MWAVSSQLYLCTGATCLFFPVYLSWCDIPCACPICGQKVLQNQSDLSLKPSYRFFKGNISLSLPYCEHFLFKKTNQNNPTKLTSKLCVQYVLWNFIFICSWPWVAQCCRSTFWAGPGILGHSFSWTMVQPGIICGMQLCPRHHLLASLEVLPVWHLLRGLTRILRFPCCNPWGLFYTGWNEVGVKAQTKD